MSTEQPKKTIALACIAGNVSVYIERFLKSFRHLTPHLYVVQACGGQTPDDTLTKAASLGAKVGVYKNHPDHADWPHVDDFAAARNQAWDMAEADGHDFLIWADTDDILPKESADRIREIVDKETFDILHAPYKLSNNGLSPYRERVVRRGVARWQRCIHEHLRPLIESPDIIQDDQAEVIHLPGTARKDSPNDRNIRLLESVPFEPWVGFYISQEYEMVGRQKEAEATVVRTLEAWKEDPKSLQTCEAVELYYMLARWAGDYETRGALLWEGVALEPWRREGLLNLSAMESDRENPPAALAYARMAFSLPKPKVLPWTHREGLYGWAGVYILTTAMRLNGMYKEADAIEAEEFSKNKGIISVIHPARGRSEQSAVTRRLFLERAKYPERIEYIFGISADDEPTASVLHRFRHAASEPGHLDDLGGTMVRNSNAAFRAANGQIIVAAQDDIDPPIWWDEQILTQIGDPTKPAVLGVKDGHRQDGLLVTQIFTKPVVPMLETGEEGCYFCPEYRGVYSDTEFSYRVHKLGLVIPTTLTFTHHHPAFGDAEMDQTYEIGSRKEAYDFGAEIFARRNPQS